MPQVKRQDRITSIRGRRRNHQIGQPLVPDQRHAPGLSTFPAAADNNGSEREPRSTATYRKVTGGLQSKRGADLFGGVRSVIGTAARHGVGTHRAIQQTLRGQAASYLS